MTDRLQPNGFSIDLSTRKGVPVHEQIRLAAGAGFTHVSCGTTLFPVLINPGEREKLFTRIRTYGLKPDWVHAPFATTPPLYHEDPEAAAVTVAAVCRLITVMASYDVSAVVVHPVSYPPDTVPTERITAAVTDGIRTMAACAAEHGVILAVENLDNLRREHYTRDVLDAVPETKFCFDSGHANLTSTLDKYLPRYADRLVALHLHDNNGIRDQHALPGEGTVDWTDVMERMRGYDGVYGLEVRSPEMLGWAGSTETFYNEAFRRLKKAVTDT